MGSPKTTGKEDTGPVVGSGDSSSGDGLPDSNSNIYTEGEKVLAYHDPRIYEAKIAADAIDLAVDKALKLDKGTQFGHVFRITKKEEPKIRKKLISQFIVLETRKDGVKFTNTKLKRLGDQYQEIVEEYPERGCSASCSKSCNFLRGFRLSGCFAL